MLILKSLQKTPRYTLRIVATLLLILSVVGVSAAAISMLEGRPIGDDYGAISTHHLKGDWGHEALESLATTGRYGQSITSSILYGMLGNHISVVLPLITLGWVLLLGFLYAKVFLKKYTKDAFLVTTVSLSVSTIFTFLILFINNPPQLPTLPGWVSFQLFFWPSGIITYTIPLLGLLTALYITFLSPIRNNMSKKTKYMLLTIAVLLSFLFNEIQPVTFIAFAVILFLASYVKPYLLLRKSRSLFISGGILATIGLILSYFSPGRIKRSETIAAPQDGSLLESVFRNLDTLGREHTLQPRELILLILVGAVLAMLIPKIIRNLKDYEKLQKSLAQTCVLMVIFLFTSTVISLALIGMGYGYGVGIYPRTLLIPQILYVLTVPLIAFTVISTLLSSKKRVLQYVAVTITSLVAIGFVISLPNYLTKVTVQVRSSMLYADQWDKQDTLLRRTSQNYNGENLYIEEPATGIGDGFSLTCTGPFASSTMWLNVQIWEYYKSNADRICEAPQEEIENN